MYVKTKTTQSISGHIGNVKLWFKSPTNHTYRVAIWPFFYLEENSVFKASFGLISTKQVTFKRIIKFIRYNLANFP